ncbi:MAG: hypothetical protein ACYDBJ_20160 [Aggregatilineales bacterium]
MSPKRLNQTDPATMLDYLAKLPGVPVDVIDTLRHQFDELQCRANESTEELIRRMTVPPNEPKPAQFSIFPVDRNGTVAAEMFGPRCETSEEAAEWQRKFKGEYSNQYHDFVVLTEADHAARLADQRRRGVVFLTRADAQSADYPAWLAEKGLIDQEHTLARLGLTWRQLRVAERLHLVHSRTMPGVLELVGYPADASLTSEQYAMINHELTLSAAEAAEELRITPEQFNRLRKQAGIKEAGTIAGHTTASGFRTTAYLYRMSDVLSLSGAAEELKRKRQGEKYRNSAIIGVAEAVK